MKISSKELLSLPTSHLHVTRLPNSRNNNNHNKFIMRKKQWGEEKINKWISHFSSRAAALWPGIVVNWINIFVYFIDEIIHCARKIKIIRASSVHTATAERKRGNALKILSRVHL